MYFITDNWDTGSKFNRYLNKTNSLPQLIEKDDRYAVNLYEQTGKVLPVIDGFVNSSWIKQMW